ncbi:MAG: hypothetical protein GJ676_05980 [Rhodobacteraceae bacterium]|nr:hypothetical protein [Paracoccaceae bacterium]
MTNPELQQATGNHPKDDNETSDNRQDLLPGIVRKKLGLSSPDMAELFGMSEVGYRSWEVGSRRPGGPALKLLALLDLQPKKVLFWLNAL